MQFDNSLSLLKKAKEIIPSAAQTYSKSYKCFCEGAAPAFIEKGDGGTVTDVDGNSYIDFILGLGPVTIGYNDERVNNVIMNYLSKGIVFSQPHPVEIMLARKITEIIPCAQMVKFLKNGSDATTAAIRLARAFTGREMILCCGYHGYHDWYIGVRSNNRGVPGAVSALTRSFAYNNIQDLETLLEQNHRKVAAVIMEPVGMESPGEGFLEEVRRLCSDHGTLLIFDEVVTGFRVALGGAQAYYGVTPDLCTMGKGIANGMPLALVAGRRDVMKMIDEGAFVSTTFGGEILSIAAALESIRIMEESEYFEHIWQLGQLWLDGVAGLIEEKKAAGFVKTAGLPPHSGIVFNNWGPVSSEDFKTLFIQEVISKGVLSLGVNNFCLAHTRSDIDEYLIAVSDALDTCVEAVDKGSASGLIKGGRFTPVFKRN